jgi:hypothetical protein
MRAWPQRNKAGAAGGAAAAAADPRAGVARDVVRLLANACYRHRPSQDLVCAAGAVPLLLERFVHDDLNPFIREWAVVAVRNLCDAHAGCQAALAAIERLPQGVVPAADLAAAGLEVELDRATGRLRPRYRQPAADATAAAAPSL